MNKSIYETIIIILIAAAVFVGLRFLIQTYIVYGPSMEPNFHEDEWIIVSKLAYKFQEPQRGDTIVFHPPVTDSKPYIKRIIGLPGESVEIKEGKVYIHKTDGTTILLDEPYIKEPFFSNYTSLTIPENEYFVMGDNRNNSSDSRNGWLVSRDKIIGKDWIAIWPPSSWGAATNYAQPSQAIGAASK
jgi:signal peptidase I